MLVFAGIFIYNIGIPPRRTLFSKIKPFEKGTRFGALFCMLNFFHDHSRVIIRLTANQFGAAFFGIALGLAASPSNRMLSLVTSVFSVLFWIFLNHTVLWEDGAKCRIRVDAGRAKYNPLVGLWICVIAGIPNLLLGVIVAVTRFLGSADGPFGFAWAGSVNAFANVIARIWQGMYLGILQFIDAGNHYLLLLTPLPAILFGFISYWLGLKNFRMFGIFTLKKPDGKGTNKKNK